MKTISKFVYRLCSEKLTLKILVLICALTASNAFANSRGKVIDFEDELVEGVNKRPLDSVSQISERDKNGRRTHLYRKRQSFKNETHETLTEMRVWQ
jgi:hypothetical protein